ncbi:NmrA/HSCARG family protein [Bdellovibrio sp. NC01]|uniref:NmrA/HSCARG family protein n=1 Tax=Bdellovibrio sp. NC01 TaxID=2220073 RepID=UPI00115932B4|nr:NmrA/HSCARG family protein [Bdellovibrio sp. NC01]QDK39327.1 NmrA family protein [Bdellovibrio sp. NC01]
MVKKILVIGATGAQGSAVVRALAHDKKYEVVIFTRNPSSEHAQELLSLPGVSAFQGNTLNEKDIYAAFRQVDGVYCNLDGFAIGEINETYWGIRTFEIAIETGIKHYVWGSLDYLVKKGGYNSKYRCGHYDAKGRVADFILQNKTKAMKVSVLTSGPYMEMLFDGVFVPKVQEDGTLVYAHPIGKGHVPMVHLEDIGKYARWIFDHPQKSDGLDLEVATEHVDWKNLVDCVQRVTGKKAVFIDLSLQEFFAKSPMPENAPAAWAQTSDAKVTTGQTYWENFSGWWSAWHDDIVTRDYEMLDKILPDRVRSLEEWMRKVKYDGAFRSVLKDLIDRRKAGTR